MIKRRDYLFIVGRAAFLFLLMALYRTLSLFSDRAMASALRSVARLNVMASVLFRIGATPREPALWSIGYALFAFQLMDLVAFYGLAISFPDSFHWPWFVPTPSMVVPIIMLWAVALWLTRKLSLSNT